MMPDDQEHPGIPQEQGGTRGYPDWQQSADPVSDVPAMEQLPDADALPDPGYPAMPTTVTLVEPPPPLTPAPPPPAVTVEPTPAREYASGVVELPGVPAPSPWPPASPAEALHARTADPYVAPRTPQEAPPRQGPSVPWSQVRAEADLAAAGEPLAAPPALAPPPPASPVAAAAAPPRETSQTLTSDLLLPGKRATPDGGWRRTVYRASGGLIHVGESTASLQRRDLVNRVRTPVAGGHHRVAVLSLKGGVGKTTVTFGLGATLASLRGDRVIAVDGNPDRGTLSDKVRLETSATIRDLLNERALVRRYADVRAFTSQARSRLEILASDRDPAVSVAFSADDYRAVAGVLEHYYSICITDCGTGLLHSAMAGILELADQIVLVSSPSVDGARSASATLDWLDAHDYGDLVRSGVVVLSAVRRKSKSMVDLDRLEQHFASRCRAVVRVPYDPHLEEGAEFELDLLNEATADAYLTFAALVADGFAYPRRAASAAPGFPLA
jgi:MinD-like ATPase involved in chromosome partitioning or flagellar assembly